MAEVSSVVDNLNVDLVWGDRAWHDNEKGLLLREDEVGDLLAVLKNSIGRLSQTIDDNLVDGLALGEAVFGGI